MKLKRAIRIEVATDEGNLVFLCRPLKVQDLDLISKIKPDQPFTSEILIELLQRTLIEWQGLEDESGKPLPFSRDLIPELPLEIAIKIGTELVGKLNELFREPEAVDSSREGGDKAQASS